ncbi:MAG: transcriptional repressor [Blautia sp.]|nr:transcriptional repressor [Blautia sp.]
MGKYKTEILALIGESEEHLTAEQIYEKLKARGQSPALATVYNNLNQLADSGEIRRLTVGGHMDRYDKKKRHDHLVCIHCGSITDLYLPDLTAQLAGELPGEELLSYDLVLHYLCPACRKKPKEL